MKLKCQFKCKHWVKLKYQLKLKCLNDSVDLQAPKGVEMSVEVSVEEEDLKEMNASLTA